MSDWIRVGRVDELKQQVLQQITVGQQKIALSYQDGVFGAISGVCNHVGGPLGKGRLIADYVTCPWHYWKFHRQSGQGEPGYERDQVPSFGVKVEGEDLFITAKPISPRHKLHHAEHPLARPVTRSPGPLRVLGISTTAMDPAHPRYSTSESLLTHALAHGAGELGALTQLLKLSDLKFRNCEGFYSKSAKACTWPCSITQMDRHDQMAMVYEAIVHWADIVLIATPIRWGAPSSLYFKMIERMNCIQNEITNHDRVLIQNKVAGFIITGGQDNVQAVAGQMLGFFSELGFVLPPFPYVAHSLGWSAENMERNVEFVQKSAALKEASAELLGRAAKVAESLLSGQNKICDVRVHRGGRKAFNPLVSGPALGALNAPDETTE